MIYPYVKVNKKVVDYLGVADQRYRFADGNYMLWKFDLMTLGGNNENTLRRIGGVGMSSEQVRAEQHGGDPTPLPEAEDEQFRMEEAAVTEEVAEDTVEEVVEDNSDEAEVSEETEGADVAEQQQTEEEKSNE